MKNRNSDIPAFAEPNYARPLRLADPRDAAKRNFQSTMLRIGGLDGGVSETASSSANRANASALFAGFFSPAPAEAAGRCASWISPQQLRELKASLLAFERAAAIEDTLAQVTTAADFYAIILSNCGNPVLEEVHKGLLARISFFRGRSMSLSGRAQLSLLEMRELYEAIAAGDEKDERKAAKRHVIRAKAAAKISMEEKGMAVRAESGARPAATSAKNVSRENAQHISQ